MGSFWDRAACFYDFSETFNARANRAMVQAAARWVSSGSRVLDCAAGTGALSLAAVKKAEAVLCTDLSPAMLAQAKRKAAAQGAGNITFAQRDLFAPPPPRPFDGVIAGNVLHLLDEPERALASLLACLRPGGRLILPTYLQGEASPLFRVLLAAYQWVGFRPKRQFTDKSYRALLAPWRPTYYQLLPGPLPVGFAVITKGMDSL